MTLNPIHSNNTSINTSTSYVSQADSETKNIQTEITLKNQRLNRLSSDVKMSAEEKAKEREEIQKQINELNRKLELLRKEQQEEDKRVQKEQEEKAAAEKKLTEAISSKEEKEDVSEKHLEEDYQKEQEEKKQIEKSIMHSRDIQKLLEAGTLIQKEQIIHNTQLQKDTAEKILEAEIKSDEIYGTDTSDKREKLSSLTKQPVPKVQIEEIKEPYSVSKDKFSGKIVISDHTL